MKARNEKAIKRYNELKKQIDLHMTAVAALIEEHVESEEEINYGHVGDLAHVEELLGQAESFLNNED